MADEQSGLVATNLYSIAESRFLPGFLTRAVRVAGEAVGFVMYGPDLDDGHIWLYRLMIDKDAQGNGFGAAALRAVIAHVRDDLAAPLIRLGVQQNNERARALYINAGFVPTGEHFGAEEILELRIRASTALD
ncbi:GNAT family N-acetyltransferase [Nocardia sp. NPDC050175]|uniref:GNAT family N-acetyltransferase n=1 Tax=Nocardia sp. NPDC050175 TaxID=3364317 RepID=UPI0037BC155D